VDAVGATQIVIGTDYPFDMGHSDPRGLVAATPGLTDADRARILGGNATALLALEATFLTNA
jgi:aminocarboxymuconate-semialdehyde decarboxylase